MLFSDGAKGFKPQNHQPNNERGFSPGALRVSSRGYPSVDDRTNFPDDENGDVLRRLQADGDDLSKPRDVDFTVVFPTEAAALQFAKIFNEEGYKTSVEHSGVVSELPWDVLVIRHMVVSHCAIGEFERELEVTAEPLGGRNDGWGCIAQTSKQ